MLVGIRATTTTIVCIELAIFSSHILGLIIISPLIIGGLERAHWTAKKRETLRVKLVVVRLPFFHYCSSWNQYPNQGWDYTFTQFSRRRNKTSLWNIYQQEYFNFINSSYLECREWWKISHVDLKCFVISLSRKLSSFISFSKLKVENPIIISDWPKTQLVLQIFIHQIQYSM